MDPKPIVLITLPKSGSMFLYHSLLMTYGLETRQHFGGEFPNIEFNRNLISEMVGGPNFISQTHVGASHHNLSVLDHFIERAVIHVRDPRQALLSFVHMLDSFTKYSQLDREIFRVDDAYFAMSLEDRISRQIDATYPQMVAWLQGWAPILNQARKCEYRLSRYDDIVTDPDGTINELARWFGFPPAELYRPDKKVSHFRNGEIDEWQRVFTPQQIEKTTAMIPNEVWNLLGESGK